METLNKVLIYLTFLTFLIAVFVLQSSQGSEENYLSDLPQQKYIKLTSPVFENNGVIPIKYTCDGEDINPPLQIGEVPEEAESLVIIVDDPDAPMGTWDHWLVWNIDPETSVIEENSVPKGAVQGTNGFGKNPYGGPCPPSGNHHYYFKAYALDKIINLDGSANRGQLERAMNNHVLDWTELVGTYQSN